MRVLEAVLALTTSHVTAQVPSCLQADETTLLQGFVRHRNVESHRAGKGAESELQRATKNEHVQVQTPGFAFPEPDLPPFTEPSEETAAPPREGNEMRLQVLDEATYGDVGGRILDGSMGNYWYGRGTSNLLIIFQDGGGSCNFVEDNPEAQFDCPWWLASKQRKYRTQHGSGPRKPTFTGNGLLDVTDPNFGDAHHARIPYLSGDSYLGQVYDPPNGCRPAVDTEDEYETAPWGTCKPYFSGHLLLRNVIHHILSNQPESRQITQLLLTGSSAGGRSSIMNCDWLQKFMDAHRSELGMQEVEVSCAPVAGYMLPGKSADHADPNQPPTPWPQWSEGEVRTLEEEASFALVEGELHKAYTNPNCRLDFPGEEWRCQMAFLAHKYVGPRVFVSQNKHDFVHMWMFLPSGDFRWVEDRDGPLPDDMRETCQGQKFMGYYGDAMQDSLLERMNDRPEDGLFLPSCYDHTRNTRHHGHRFDQRYTTRTVINVNGHDVDSLDAVTRWFFRQGTQQVVITDNCESGLGAPCNPTCVSHIEDVSDSCCSNALDELCGAHHNCLACAFQNKDALRDAGCTVQTVQQACA